MRPLKQLRQDGRQGSACMHERDADARDLVFGLEHHLKELFAR